MGNFRHPPKWRYYSGTFRTEAAERGGPLPDSKRGEDQLPALLVPAERGDVLFIKERYLPGDMGVKNVRTLAKSNPPSTFEYEMRLVGATPCVVDATSRSRFAAPAPTSRLACGTGLLGIWIRALVRDARTIFRGIQNNCVCVGRSTDTELAQGAVNRWAIAGRPGRWRRTRLR
jgi:hypothetical protein